MKALDVSVFDLRGISKFKKNSGFLVGIARKLASSGYAVSAMDYPGFGLSEGLHCYIPSFDNLVDDVIEHYSKVKGISKSLICT